MAISGVGDLPPEIILSLMERFPDVATLNNFILSNRSIYNIFSNHPTDVVVSVLKNELGEDLLIHAIVAHQVEKMGVTLPCFASLSMDQIDSQVANLRGIRDQAFILHYSSPRHSSISISLRDADRISSMWTKISQLSEAFVKDCTRGLGRVFYPLQESIQQRPVSVFELRRIRQSMYMFHILSIFCQDLFLDIRLNQHNQIVQHTVNACVDKISKLQCTLVDGFMAPWELYQVVSLQAWFRRQLRELERDSHLNERLMPYLLSRGIECMHQGICIDGEARWGAASERDGGFYFFIKKMKEKARRCPAHGFGMILSRGRKDNWTRKTPMQFDQYNSFWGRRDKGAYSVWSNLEIPMMHRLGFDVSAPGSYDPLAETEGILDVWSAAFWDPIRWPDIRRSMDGNMQPSPWHSVSLPWDSFRVGWESALDPRMRNGMMPETRNRPFSAWFVMMVESILEYTISLVMIPAAILMVITR
ncbi:hypothetical protein J3F84DRAFT_407177 [Trichoderma pleuroticola]